MPPRVGRLTRKRKRPSGNPSRLRPLTRFFKVPEALGVPLCYHSMEDSPGPEYLKVKYGRPPGYQARSRLIFGNLQVPGLLDTCASRSVFPEELAIAKLSHASQGVTSAICLCAYLAKISKHHGETALRLLATSSTLCVQKTQLRHVLLLQFLLPFRRR